MITVQIKGGLGNQLFQYAYARWLVEHTNQTVQLDTSWYSHTPRGSTVRDFGLHHFPLALSWGEYQLTQSEPHHLRVLRAVQARLRPRRNLGWSPLREELRHGDHVLAGYWQTHRYADDIRPQLLVELTKPKLSHPNRVQQVVSGLCATPAATVALHIRRGDYVSNKRTLRDFGVCSLRYYTNALAYMADNLGTSFQVVVFSDDYDWAKEHLTILQSACFVGDYGLADYEELYVFSQCTHAIIANSSFSWWGAWLSTSPTKRVIAPKPWFSRREKQYTYLIPNTWIRIPK